MVVLQFMEWCLPTVVQVGLPTVQAVLLELLELVQQLLHQFLTQAHPLLLLIQ
jgi:hypothetical protein